MFELDFGRLNEIFLLSKKSSSTETLSTGKPILHSHNCNCEGSSPGGGDSETVAPGAKRVELVLARNFLGPESCNIFEVLGQKLRLRCWIENDRKVSNRNYV